jgi:hypothetical protein
MVAEMIEDIDWETAEAEDWESDETFAESEDSAEDIGERTRRRTPPRRYYRPGRGVQGMTVRRPGGGVQRVPFPAPLATAAETNRGLANQELARRQLSDRLRKIEAKARAQAKRDGSVSGLVTLTIAGSLTTFGVIKAAGQPSGTRLADWAQRDSTRTAAVISAAQLATSGAKFVINGRYHRSGLGIAADIFSIAQLGTFAFASLRGTEDFARPVADKAAADVLKNNARIGTVFVAEDTGLAYRVVPGVNNQVLLRQIV